MAVYLLFIYYQKPQIHGFGDEWVAVFATTLGFSVTCYTIITSFDKRIIDRMTQKADKGAGFFESVCATFILSMLIQILTILSLLLGDIFKNIWYDTSSFTLSVLTLWSLLDVIVSLYTLRTLINPKKTEE